VRCWANAAAIQVTDDALLAHPHATLGHEYGHVWANYYRWSVWNGSWNSYLSARGLLVDSRVGSSYCWLAEELIANDYQRLLAGPETTAGVYIAWCPSDLSSPSQVSGLRDYLALTWTAGDVPPGYSGGSAATPTATSTPAPTSTPSPVTTATPSPTPTSSAAPATATGTSVPSATATPSPTATPAGENVVTMDFGNGWNSFVAPITGKTNKVVYFSLGKKDLPTTEVQRGKGYRVKGPVHLEIWAQ
jgi:hypothetical protein